MNEIFFTSDTHFSHKNIIIYCERPFKDIDEMNECIIQNWNDTVSKTDIVYHLGDVTFSKPSISREILSRLNGHVILIPGNHDDKRVLKVCSEFFYIDTTSDLCVNINEHKIFLSHDYRKHYNKKGFLHFHGHEHGTDLVKSYNMSYDEVRKRFKNEKWFGVKNNAIEVGVDLWNYKPAHIEDILKKLI